jgi:hypothetical protein
MHISRFFVILCFIIFFGCTNQVPYGYFVTPGTSDLTPLAADGIKQLSLLQPPAKTQLALIQPATDPFGVLLVAGLRQHGYAIQESFTPDKTSNVALPLQYVVDSIDPHLLRLSLSINGQALARVYALQQGQWQPAGAWTYQEVA